MRKNKLPETSRRRPWRFLRLAILWAQKPGALKQRQFFDIRLLPAYLRNLRRSACGDQLHCRERELSFDETPTFHFRIPCITPSVNFDDRDEMFSGRRGEVKVLEGGWEESHDYEEDGEEEGEEEEEEGIDLRAERFIMEFYEQMKLQRQMSYLEYDEMIHRGTGG